MVRWRSSINDYEVLLISTNFPSSGAIDIRLLEDTFVPADRADKLNIERTHLVTWLVFSGQFGRGVHT